MKTLSQETLNSSYVDTTPVEKQITWVGPGGEINEATTFIKPMGFSSAVDMWGIFKEEDSDVAKIKKQNANTISVSVYDDKGNKLFKDASDVYCEKSGREICGNLTDALMYVIWEVNGLLKKT